MTTILLMELLDYEAEIEHQALLAEIDAFSREFQEINT